MIQSLVCVMNATQLAQDFLLGQNRRGGLGSGEDAVDDLLAGVQAPLFEPEHDVRLSRHRTDLDLLLAPDEAGGHAGVDGVDQARRIGQRRIPRPPLIPNT